MLKRILANTDNGEFYDEIEMNIVIKGKHIINDCNMTIKSN